MSTVLNILSMADMWNRSEVKEAEGRKTAKVSREGKEGPCQFLLTGIF